MVVRMKENYLTGTRWYGAENLWAALQEACAFWNQKEAEEKLTFHSERKKEFIDFFAKYYETIKGQFMTPETKALDTHKQAAIMLISAWEANAIEQTPCEEGQIPLGCQAVMLDVAFSYLEQSINRKLEDIRVRPIKLKLPEALACDTSYFNILRRMLYYELPTRGRQGSEKYKMNYNILEWSDRFFLLEYITLLENGIDPKLIKDNVRKGTGN